MKIDFNNGELTITITHKIKVNDVENIVSYLEKMDSEIEFDSGDTKEYYNNLFDSTDSFKYSDCDALFYLGILTYSFTNDSTFFGLEEGYLSRLVNLRREYKINSLVK